MHQFVLCWCSVFILMCCVSAFYQVWNSCPRCGKCIQFAAAYLQDNIMTHCWQINRSSSTLLFIQCQSQATELCAAPFVTRRGFWTTYVDCLGILFWTLHWCRPVCTKFPLSLLYRQCQHFFACRPCYFSMNETGCSFCMWLFTLVPFGLFISNWLTLCTSSRESIATCNDAENDKVLPGRNDQWLGMDCYPMTEDHKVVIMFCEVSYNYNLFWPWWLAENLK